MNPEAATNPSNIRVKSLDFRDLPDQSALFRVFLSESLEVTKQFWPNRDTPLKDFSETVISSYNTDRNLLCDALQKDNLDYGAGEVTLENIARLRQTDSVAVVTGQQAGLFSGPAYTLYKALSTIKIAAALRDSGVNAVPVFWIASEDHDFDEISVAYFRDRSRDLASVRLPLNEVYEGFPVGRIPLGAKIQDAIEQFFGQMEDSAFSGPLREAITESYQEETDLATAFGRLMTSWLSKYGLVFTNPLNPAIRKLSAPIFSDAAKSISKIRDGLIEANRKLKQGGYHVQVEANEDYFPLFYFSDNGIRISLRETNGIVSSKDRSFESTVDELAALVLEKPELFSPKALFRPIVQDFVFPTVCYVGGSAEISYFAQNVSIYEVHSRPVTPIRHRAAVTLLDSRHRRTLEAYDLVPDDLWLGYETVLDRIIKGLSDGEARRELEESREVVLRKLDMLGEALSGLDPGLSDNFENRKKKILWNIDALERKFLSFEKRRNHDAVRRLRDLFDSGFPKGVPQERIICFADHLNRYGPQLLDWVYQNIDESGANHRVVSF